MTDNIRPKEISFLPGTDDAMAALAQEVLEECRKTLMMSMRFLDAALWHMPFSAEQVHFPLATDGSKMYFGSIAVLNRFRDTPDEMVRDYLHAILHCVFHHPFDEKHEDHDAWSLCCDISAEVTAVELVSQRFPSAQDEERLKAAERLMAKCGALTPNALYKVLSRGGVGEANFARHGFTHDEIRRLTTLFRRDSHDGWAFNREKTTERQDTGEREPLPDANRADKTMDEDTPVPEPIQDPEQSNDEKDMQDSPEGEEPQLDTGSAEQEEQTSTEGEAEASQQAESSSGSQDGDSGESSIDQSDTDMDQAEQEWTDISKRIEADLESFSKSQGNGVGSMMASLAIANRKPCDYNDFLRRFATMAEDMRLNDEEFDYIFYTYGMEHYNRMPFIEPLEYKESNRVREFVIALDTSGSCSGELIKTFVTRTYDVLHQTEGFGDKINVHVIQCDNRIQSDTKITSVQELERFRDSFWVKGFGGTDFRPVFEYVDAMLADGEFEDLRGLIYFTDGLGSFPARAPEYETAFVFVNDGTTKVSVPPWAMKVVMTEDEVYER